ncbi:AlbA family DNA-binding domain-containing protein [Desulfovibrio oxyclinae]|uniref:AlbA family DNA-binding domain-containing protein n=1 Tax=Desulfovibrio oxyclinae TaxID=63560 RepID=UPI00037CE23C|nr:ATP-binding protein [Desulfovibrio oxyclinae]
MKWAGGRSLYRTLVICVILAALAVGFLAVWGVRSFREDAAAMAVENSVKGLAGTVSVLVNVLSETGERQQFSGLDDDQVRRRVMKVMRDRTLMSGILVSDESGLEMAVLREGEMLASGYPLDGTFRWNVSKEDRQRLPDINLDSLEHRLQSERAALKPGQFSWTSAYTFHGHGESWMTVSWLLGEKGRMLTFILPVSVVVDQLARADRGEAQKLFLFWETERFMDIPKVEDGETPSPQAAVSPDELRDPVAAKAAEMLMQDHGLRGSPFRFRVSGQVWWGGSRPLSAFGDSMYLGVAMPQSSVNTELSGDRFIYGFGGAIVLAAMLALYLLRRYRSRIEGLGLRQAYASPEDVRALIDGGENERVEFKQTLRFNVKAGKNGREIELASVKTVTAFLNSRGGTLLIGVSDSGEVLGLDDDKFENDDRALLHFNNLLGQHVGVHFQPFVNARVVHLDGKSVIRVNCVRADAPAFLVNGQTEEFYARSGPASRKLTVRQFYEYLRSSRSRFGGHR